MKNESTKLSFFTVGELSKMLGVGPNTVLQWIHDGSLRATNVSPTAGNRPRWRIAEADFEEFLSARAAVQEA